MNVEKVIEWCDKQVAEGKEIVLKWDGGNDSGWLTVEVDGTDMSYREGCEEVNWLIDYLNDVLDYGSWAGDFSANGEAPYDPKTKSFEGIDSFGTEEGSNVVLQTPITFEIPDYFAFDMIEVHTEGETFHVDIALNGRNRLEDPEEDEYFKAVSEKLKEDMNKAFDNNADASQLEIASTWNDYNFDKAEMEHIDGKYICKIDKIYFNYYESEDRNIYISLKDMLEEQEN